MLGIDEDFLPRSFDDAKATTLQLLPRILDPDDDTRDIIRNLHNRRNIRIGLPHVVQAAMCRFFLPHSYADLLGLHGNAVVDRGVGIIYRSLGQVVSAVGQFRPDALEAWEIKRVSRRLENVLNAMRNNATEDLQEQHAVNKSLTLLKELSRAILSV